MQGLSSPGWQSVRAGEDPALFTWLPLFLKYQRFARPDSGKPQSNYTDEEENLFIALWIVTGEKGAGAASGYLRTAPAPRAWQGF